MDDLNDAPGYLSLRWKALIILSLILVLVNASLALLAYRQAVGQFELQQADVRAQQTRELRALLKEGFERMSKLAYFVPLLEAPQPAKDLATHLQRVLDLHGFMLNVEWDVRAVQLIGPDGKVRVSLPDADADAAARRTRRALGRPA
jgi:hypothetical protein